MSTRPPNPTQLSPHLPGLTRHITTHTPVGKSTLHSSTPGTWTPLFNDTMAFNVLYTTSTSTSTPTPTPNINLNAEADIHAHSALTSTGPIPLTHSSGSVCRIVDFGPGSEPVMHRTVSLDYGVVLEGEVEMLLEEGEESVVLRRGDVAVQRGTMHAWRNLSGTEWARMLFVLLPCEAVEVGGRVLGEELGVGRGELDAKKAEGEGSGVGGES